MRPKTLAEVARLTRAGDSFDLCLANFLDEFEFAPSATAWADEPMPLEPVAGERGAVQDAYLAATAEHLAWTKNMPVPAWIWADSRKLRRPWFASSLAALRAVLIRESPAAFRSRNLFVSENSVMTVSFSHFEQHDLPRSDRFEPFVFNRPSNTASF